MVTIDERIKEELERDSTQLDELLAETRPMNAMLADAYKGGLRRSMMAVSVITGALIVTVIFLIYKWTSATDLAAQLNSGIWLVLAMISLVGFELWAWMEIGRISTRRDIKQLELTIRRLAD
ncbi:MAG: hypothetical protein JKY60_02525 [Kordiimonadaceae bacterium]|nr:hypothetical protein [Kordiimonadaceae bacterium]